MSYVRDGVDESDLVGKRQAFANQVALMDRPDTPILSFFSPNLQNLRTSDGMVPHGQRTYTYKEKQRRQMRTTLNGAINSSATTLVIDDKICRPNDLIVMGDEVIQLGGTTDDLTFTGCTRSVYTGAAAAHSDAAEILVLGTSYVEGSNAPSAGAHFESTIITTYTEIFMDAFEITGSAEPVIQWSEEDMDKVNEMGLETSVDLKKQLQYRLVWGDAQAPNGKITPGRLDGLHERIAASSSINIGSAAGSESDITYQDLQQAVRKSDRLGGGGPYALMTNDYQSHQMDTWIQSQAQRTPSEMAQAVFGSEVTAIRVGKHTVDIIATDEWQTNSLLTSYQNVRVGPQHASRVFHIVLLAQNGDYTKWMVRGEYTAEVALPFSHVWMKYVKLN